MTNQEYDKLIAQVNNEIDEYRKFMKSLDSEKLYESHYEIEAYEDISEFIERNAKNYSYKAFPKKNILDFFYYQFMKTDHELTNEDLVDFFYNTTLDNLRNRNFDEEM
jgi:hypothetical protein